MLAPLRVISLILSSLLIIVCTYQIVILGILAFHRKFYKKSFRRLNRLHYIIVPINFSFSLVNLLSTIFRKCLGLSSEPTAHFLANLTTSLVSVTFLWYQCEFILVQDSQHRRATIMCMKFALLSALLLVAPLVMLVLQVNMEGLIFNWQESALKLFNGYVVLFSVVYILYYGYFIIKKLLNNLLLQRGYNRRETRWGYRKKALRKNIRSIVKNCLILSLLGYGIGGLEVYMGFREYLSFQMLKNCESVTLEKSFFLFSRFLFKIMQMSLMSLSVYIVWI